MAGGRKYIESLLRDSGTIDFKDWESRPVRKKVWIRYGKKIDKICQEQLLTAS